jgi:NADH-quinone oxidoreductase subunit H
LAERAHLFVVTSTATALFLGGWRVPGVASMVQESSRRLEVLGAVLFLLKLALLLGAIFALRRTVTRLFVEDVAALYARWAVPASVAGGVLAVFWAAGFDGARSEAVADLLGLSVSGWVGALLLAVGAARFWTGPAQGSISTVNPWL